MIIGYSRPLYEDLQCDQQITLLKERNCTKIFKEDHASAKRRLELKRVIDMLQPEDLLIVTRLYALADSTHHLAELLIELEKKKAFLLSIQENIDTRKKEGFSFSYIVNQIAEFQSEVISEKTKKGIDKAKERGSNLGRPKKPDENVQKAILMYKSKNYTLKEIREETGISKSTLYRYLEN